MSTGEYTPAQQYLLDPEIRAGLSSAFGQIDTLRDDLWKAGGTVYDEVSPGITDEGTYVEILDVSGAGDIEIPGACSYARGRKRLGVVRFALGDVAASQFAIGFDNVVGEYRPRRSGIQVVGLEPVEGQPDASLIFGDKSPGEPLPEGYVLSKAVAGGESVIFKHRGALVRPFREVREELGITID